MSYYYVDHLLVKNPNKLHNLCKENTVYIDLYSNTDSILWESMLNKYFKKYTGYKNRYLSIKDFYVLIFYAQTFNQLNINTLSRGQELLLLLPKIYDGDHISIIHSLSNIAVTGNFSNLIMYRDLQESNLPIYGNGYLIIQYRNSKKDIYIKKTELDNYKFVKHVHPFYGGYNKFIK